VAESDADSDARGISEGVGAVKTLLLAAIISTQMIVSAFVDSPARIDGLHVSVADPHIVDAARRGNTIIVTITF
jgi:hypothetical protein